MLGAAQFITLNNILDDTGSSCLELFRDDDYQQLGLTPAYHTWMNNVMLDTANGTVPRRSLQLEVQLLVNGAPFGPVDQVRATITPGVGANQLRCSGMFLRQALFTATNPNGQGILYISDKKTVWPYIRNMISVIDTYQHVCSFFTFGSASLDTHIDYSIHLK